MPIKILSLLLAATSLVAVCLPAFAETPCGLPDPLLSDAEMAKYIRYVERRGGKVIWGDVGRKILIERNGPDMFSQSGAFSARTKGNIGTMVFNDDPLIILAGRPSRGVAFHELSHFRDLLRDPNEYLLADEATREGNVQSLLEKWRRWKGQAKATGRIQPTNPYPGGELSEEFKGIQTEYAANFEIRKLLRDLKAKGFSDADIAGMMDFNPTGCGTAGGELAAGAVEAAADTAGFTRRMVRGFGTAAKAGGGFLIQLGQELVGPAGLAAVVSTAATDDPLVGFIVADIVAGAGFTYVSYPVISGYLASSGAIAATAAAAPYVGVALGATIGGIIAAGGAEYQAQKEYRAYRDYGPCEGHWRATAGMLKY